jgi:hypothetical protein
MAVSLIAFIIFTAHPKDRYNFNSSFFMAHKAFFIAIIYGIVIMGGTLGLRELCKLCFIPK